MVIMLMTTRRPRAAMAAAGLMTLFIVSTTGCASGGGAAEGTPSTRVSGQEKARAKEGLVDILVAGRPITGTKPSGHAKIPYQRTYAEGELYAAVTGYRSLAFGSAGLESIYKDVHGTVETTIDPALQRAAAEGLRGRKGAAVALDAETGRIRALMSTPSYDPSAFSGYANADRAAWKEVTDSRDHPLLNRALRSTAPLGRTSHVVVAAAALEKGLYATVDVPTRTPGAAGQCANASIRQALQHGCDEVFTGMASEVGQEALRSMAEALGFNEKALDVPVRVAESTYRDGETTATPLQMARVMAVLGNGGKQLGPRLVDRVVHGDGSVQKPTTYTAAGRQVVKRETADQLRTALSDRATGDGWSLALTRAAGGRLVALAVYAKGAGDDDMSAVVDRMAKAATG